MKLSFCLLALLFTAACATTSVQKKMDPFSGGEVTSLTHNQLDTPGFGDIYFDVEAIKTSKAVTLKVTGKADYEAQGLDPILHIDKTKEFVAIADGQRIALKPVNNSYTHVVQTGMSLPLHVEAMNYEISMADLKKISAAKSVSMKLFMTNHREGGLTGNFDAKNMAKLAEFVNSVEDTTVAPTTTQK